MKNHQRFLKSFQSLFVLFSAILLFLFFLKNILLRFIRQIPHESVLLDMLKINFTELIRLGFFLFGLSLAFLLTVGLLFWLAVAFLNWEKETAFKRFTLIERGVLALFPTLLLAGALDADAFVMITSMISFVTIFSFLFKNNANH